MRLAEFIVTDMDRILAEWDAFAATLLPAAGSMSSRLLRDHAKQILQAIARDLSAVQTESAQAAKSKGLGPKSHLSTDTAAETHGLLRAQSGFDIMQMASEYRALRASVLRLWMRSALPSYAHLDDVIRFNEAIDQALAESISYFTEKVDESRNLFLGMLGHDMRTPLHAIHLTAQYLSKLDASENISKAASLIVSSGARMSALLNDLVEFNQTNLGAGIPIRPSETDMAELFTSELELVQAAHPGRSIELSVTGTTTGLWDGTAIQRVLGNLVVNAIKYGDEDSAVCVELEGADDELRFKVKNAGPTIPQASLDLLFEPLRRGLDGKGDHYEPGSLGLGLFIAREIAKSHGGTIEGRSKNHQTVFSVHLPRRLPEQ